MKPNWIIFDMDEVVVNIRDTLAQALAEHTGNNLHPDQWHQYNLEEIYNVDSDTLVKLFHSSKMLEIAQLEPDALQAMQLAKKLGYHIGILTARGWHPQGLELTHATIEKHKLPVDHVVAVPLDTKKYQVIKKHFEGTIAGFVDDNVGHVAGVKTLGIESVLRDRPWNRDALEYPRTHSLVAFVQQVHKIQQEQNTAMAVLTIPSYNS